MDGRDEINAQVVPAMESMELDSPLHVLSCLLLFPLLPSLL